MAIQIIVAANESLRLSRQKIRKPPIAANIVPKARTWLQWIVQLLSF
jgi:hypothetical protein